MNPTRGTSQRRQQLSRTGHRKGPIQRNPARADSMASFYFGTVTVRQACWRGTNRVSGNRFERVRLGPLYTRLVMEHLVFFSSFAAPLQKGAS